MGGEVVEQSLELAGGAADGTSPFPVVKRGRAFRLTLSVGGATGTGCWLLLVVGIALDSSI